eukprot:3283426-Pyramimonas_sp.AAC.1
MRRERGGCEKITLPWREEEDRTMPRTKGGFSGCRKRSMRLLSERRFCHASDDYLQGRSSGMCMQGVP